MESTGVFSTSRNIDYWILILCLFLLAAVGYGFQIARFVLLDLVACYFLCKNIRAYLKTSDGIYFKELDMGCKEERFLNMLLENVLKEIAKVL